MSWFLCYRYELNVVLDDFALHYILIKGKSDEGYLINDPGLPAEENRIVKSNDFLEAFDYPGGNSEVAGFRLLG